MSMEIVFREERNLNYWTLTPAQLRGGMETQYVSGPTLVMLSIKLTEHHTTGRTVHKGNGYELHLWKVGPGASGESTTFKLYKEINKKRVIDYEMRLWTCYAVMTTYLSSRRYLNR